MMLKTAVLGDAGLYLRLRIDGARSSCGRANHDCSNWSAVYTYILRVLINNTRSFRCIVNEPLWQIVILGIRAARAEPTYLPDMARLGIRRDFSRFQVVIDKTTTVDEFKGAAAIIKIGLQNEGQGND